MTPFRVTAAILLEEDITRTTFGCASIKRVAYELRIITLHVVQCNAVKGDEDRCWAKEAPSRHISKRHHKLFRAGDVLFNIPRIPRIRLRF